LFVLGRIQIIVKLRIKACRFSREKKKVCSNGRFICPLSWDFIGQ